VNVEVSKPVFSAQSKTAGIRCRLLINDVVATRCVTGGSLCLEVQINHLLHSGINTFAFEVEDSGGVHQHGSARVTVSIRDPITSSEAVATCLQFELIGGGAGRGLQALVRTPAPYDIAPSYVGGARSGIAVRSKVLTPWRQRFWHTLPQLRITDDVVKLARTAHEELCVAIKRQDTDSIGALLSRKRGVYMEALYLDAKTADDVIGFQGLALSDDAELIEPDWNRFKMELCGNGRLLRFVDGRGDGPISFRRSKNLRTYMTAYYGMVESRLVQVL